MLKTKAPSHLLTLEMASLKAFAQRQRMCFYVELVTLRTDGLPWLQERLDGPYRAQEHLQAPTYSVRLRYMLNYYLLWV